MNFEISDLENNFWHKLGNNLGFGLSVVLFGSVLYLILYWFKKIPAGFTYWQILELGLALYLMRLIFQGIKKR